MVAGAAGTATGQPPDHLVVVDDELEHHVELDAAVGEHVVEDLGLRDRAREAVEQEAAVRVVLGQPVADHVDGDVVRDEVAPVHERLGLEPERGPLADVRAEDVAGRDLGHREVLGDELRLCPLAGSGWPDEDEAH